MSIVSKISSILSRTSSKRYLGRLRKMGAKIGEGTTVFYPGNVFIDDTRPWMIEIGKNVQITKNVSVLTHDYSWSVLKGKYGDILGACGKVTIGDNVFLGFNVTILKGVKIGNNVIIGVNSVVTHDIPDDSIACGNPAKVIMKLDEFYDKRKEKQLAEACDLINNYIRITGKRPDDKILREFIFLYKERDNQIELNPIFSEISSLVGNKNQTIDAFMESKPKFNGIDELIKYAQKHRK